MKALRFTETGSLDNLAVADIDRPEPGPGEVLVKVQAAAINPSDVKNVLGKMPMTTVPRTPGRDFAGLVEQGPPELIGRPVFGTGGDMGFRRDGSHAEYLAVPAEAVLIRPDGLEPEDASALALAYLTAWSALVDAAGLDAGETVLITGVTGSVGSAAARIARFRGATVLGTVQRADDVVEDLTVDHYINLQNHSLTEEVMAATSGRGVDVVLDVVGGPMFEPCLCCLTHGGRQVAIGSIGDGRVSFNLVEFYHRAGRLYGVDTLALNFTQSAAVLRGLMPGIEAKKFTAPEVESIQVEEAIDAYRRLNDGTARRKLVMSFAP
ncbi:zinc-binding alcohol dehydrogenase family protein [Mycobacterium sp.]|jgi:NADPH:quinone reductase-like Zn-dependent oxidoreductase|uniref:quinone oxidoreductase family protein n=1 Tax=Mycobacterium sp. TaxID=1785 RepID=UPI002D4DC118|nr:zinc-binding alcohol dehydrogenase family protein [Mycobacterium sp.]HZA12738.1 zinc-binding alcohol dehydrogenase family protein [Mycobacterium sp.]